jgi:hypothetical protein
MKVSDSPHRNYGIDYTDKKNKYGQCSQGEKVSTVKNGASIRNKIGEGKTRQVR